MHSTLTNLALITLIGAAVLSFMNKENLAKAKEDSGTNKETLKASENDLADAKKELAGLNEETAQLNAKVTKFREQIVELEAETSKKEDQRMNLEDDLRTAEEELDRLEKDEAKIGSIKLATSELEDLESANKQLSGRLAELDGQVLNLTSTSADLQSQIEAANQQLKDWKEGRVPASFTAPIVRAYQRLGFVTIGAGIKQRAAVGAKLVVRRGEVDIAQLTITDLHPDTSVANVVRGSMAQGTSIRPGDLVFPVVE